MEVSMKKLLTLTLVGALVLSSQTSQAVRVGTGEGDIKEAEMTALKETLKKQNPTWKESRLTANITEMDKAEALGLIKPNIAKRAYTAAKNKIVSLPWKKIGTITGKSAASLATIAAGAYLVNGGLHFIPTEVRRAYTYEWMRKASIALGGESLKNVYSHIGAFFANDTLHTVLQRIALANVAVLSSAALAKKGFGYAKSYVGAINPFAKETE